DHVAGDAQRQSQHGQCGETRVPPELAKRITQVLHEHVHFISTSSLCRSRTLPSRKASWASALLYSANARISSERAEVRSFCNCSTTKLLLLPLSILVCSACKATSANSRAWRVVPTRSKFVSTTFTASSSCKRTSCSNCLSRSSPCSRSDLLSLKFSRANLLPNGRLIKSP